MPGKGSVQLPGSSLSHRLPTVRREALSWPAVKRTVAWSTVAFGRRIHDLRHIGACLWLAKGVDPVNVQAWLGHASIATTNIYLHWSA